MLVAGPHLPTLADVTSWLHWEETGLEPGLTAKVRGPGLVTWPPSQTRRRMRWSPTFSLVLECTGSGELMLPLRGRGSGLTEHPGATQTGVAASRMILGTPRTILPWEAAMACGRISRKPKIFGSFVSIKKEVFVHFKIPHGIYIFSMLFF